MKIHGFDQGLSLTLPPLSVIYLRCAKELEPDEAQKEIDIFSHKTVINKFNKDNKINIGGILRCFQKRK